MHPAVEQCRWIDHRIMDIRFEGRSALLDSMPDEDWDRFLRLWRRAEHSGRDGSAPRYPNAKQRAFLDRVEAGVRRMMAGRPYPCPDPAVRQPALFE